MSSDRRRENFSDPRHHASSNEQIQKVVDELITASQNSAQNQEGDVEIEIGQLLTPPELVNEPTEV